MFTLQTKAGHFSSCRPVVPGYRRFIATDGPLRFSNVNRTAIRFTFAWVLVAPIAIAIASRKTVSFILRLLDSLPCQTPNHHSKPITNLPESFVLLCFRFGCYRSFSFWLMFYDCGEKKSKQTIQQPVRFQKWQSNFTVGCSTNNSCVKIEGLIAIASLTSNRCLGAGDIDEQFIIETRGFKRFSLESQKLFLFCFSVKNSDIF